jgi:uncharacterized protein YndB with AHSA1/START domain
MFDIGESTLRMTRRFRVSRDFVFAAFTSHADMARWFGPAGCKVTGGGLDFREGGRYRIQVERPEGGAIVGGTYREISAPEKLVFTWQWEGDEDWANTESLVTIEFTVDGEETELRLTQVGFPFPESRGRHEHGWSGSFDKLEAMLASPWL